MNCMCVPSSATFHQGHHQVSYIDGNAVTHSIWKSVLPCYTEGSAITLYGGECLVLYVDAL